MGVEIATVYTASGSGLEYSTGTGVAVTLTAADGSTEATTVNIAANGALSGNGDLSNYVSFVTAGTEAGDAEEAEVSSELAQSVTFTIDNGLTTATIFKADAEGTTVTKYYTLVDGEFTDVDEVKANAISSYATVTYKNGEFNVVGGEDGTEVANSETADHSATFDELGIKITLTTDDEIDTIELTDSAPQTLSTVTKVSGTSIQVVTEADDGTTSTVTYELSYNGDGDSKQAVLTPEGSSKSTETVAQADSASVYAYQASVEAAGTDYVVSFDDSGKLTGASLKADDGYTAAQVEGTSIIGSDVTYAVELEGYSSATHVATGVKLTSNKSSTEQTIATDTAIVTVEVTDTAVEALKGVSFVLTNGSLTTVTGLSKDSGAVVDTDKGAVKIGDITYTVNAADSVVTGDSYQTADSQTLVYAAEVASVPARIVDTGVQVGTATYDVYFTSTGELASIVSGDTTITNGKITLDDTNKGELAAGDYTFVVDTDTSQVSLVSAASTTAIDGKDTYTPALTAVTSGYITQIDGYSVVVDTTTSMAAAVFSSTDTINNLLTSESSQISLGSNTYDVTVEADGTYTYYQEGDNATNTITGDALDSIQASSMSKTAYASAGYQQGAASATFKLGDNSYTVNFTYDDLSTINELSSSNGILENGTASKNVSASVSGTTVNVNVDGNNYALNVNLEAVNKVESGAYSLNGKVEYDFADTDTKATTIANESADNIVVSTNPNLAKVTYETDNAKYVFYVSPGSNATITRIPDSNLDAMSDQNEAELWRNNSSATVLRYTKENGSYSDTPDADTEGLTVNGNTFTDNLVGVDVTYTVTATKITSTGFATNAAITVTPDKYVGAQTNLAAAEALPTDHLWAIQGTNAFTAGVTFVNGTNKYTALQSAEGTLLAGNTKAAKGTYIGGGMSMAAFTAANLQVFTVDAADVLEAASANYVKISEINTNASTAFTTAKGYVTSVVAMTGTLNNALKNVYDNANTLAGIYSTYLGAYVADSNASAVLVDASNTLASFNIEDDVFANLTSALAYLNNPGETAVSGGMASSFGLLGTGLGSVSNTFAGWTEAVSSASASYLTADYFGDGGSFASGSMSVAVSALSNLTNALKNMYSFDQAINKAAELVKGDNGTAAWSVLQSITQAWGALTNDNYSADLLGASQAVLTGSFTGLSSALVAASADASTAAVATAVNNYNTAFNNVMDLFTGKLNGDLEHIGLAASAEFATAYQSISGSLKNGSWADISNAGIGATVSNASYIYSTNAGTYYNSTSLYNDILGVIVGNEAVAEAASNVFQMSDSTYGFDMGAAGGNASNLLNLVAYAYTNGVGTANFAGLGAGSNAAMSNAVWLTVFGTNASTLGDTNDNVKPNGNAQWATIAGTSGFNINREVGYYGTALTNATTAAQNMTAISPGTIISLNTTAPSAKTNGTVMSGVTSALVIANDDGVLTLLNLDSKQTYSASTQPAILSAMIYSFRQNALSLVNSNAYPTESYWLTTNASTLNATQASLKDTNGAITGLYTLPLTSGTGLAQGEIFTDSDGNTFTIAGKTVVENEASWLVVAKDSSGALYTPENVTNLSVTYSQGSVATLTAGTNVYTSTAQAANVAVGQAIPAGAAGTAVNLLSSGTCATIVGTVANASTVLANGAISAGEYMLVPVGTIGTSNVILAVLRNDNNTYSPLTDSNGLQDVVNGASDMTQDGSSVSITLSVPQQFTLASTNGSSTYTIMYAADAESNVNFLAAYSGASINASTKIATNGAVYVSNGVLNVTSKFLGSSAMVFDSGLLTTDNNTTSVMLVSSSGAGVDKTYTLGTDNDNISLDATTNVQVTARLAIPGLADASSSKTFIASFLLKDGALSSVLSVVEEGGTDSLMGKTVEGDDGTVYAFSDSVNGFLTVANNDVSGTGSYNVTYESVSNTPVLTLVTDATPIAVTAGDVTPQSDGGFWIKLGDKLGRLNDAGVLEGVFTSVTEATALTVADGVSISEDGKSATVKQADGTYVVYTVATDAENSNKPVSVTESKAHTSIGSTAYEGRLATEPYYTVTAGDYTIVTNVAGAITSVTKGSGETATTIDAANISGQVFTDGTIAYTLTVEGFDTVDDASDDKVTLTPSLIAQGTSTAVKEDEIQHADAKYTATITAGGAQYDIVLDSTGKLVSAVVSGTELTTAEDGTTNNLKTSDTQFTVTTGEGETATKVVWDVTYLNNDTPEDRSDDSITVKQDGTQTLGANESTVLSAKVDGVTLYFDTELNLINAPDGTYQVNESSFTLNGSTYTYDKETSKLTVATSDGSGLSYEGNDLDTTITRTINTTIAGTAVVITETKSNDGAWTITNVTGEGVTYAASTEEGATTVGKVTIGDRSYDLTYNAESDVISATGEVAADAELGTYTNVGASGELTLGDITYTVSVGSDGKVTVKGPNGYENNNGAAAIVEEATYNVTVDGTEVKVVNAANENDTVKTEQSGEPGAVWTVTIEGQSFAFASLEEGSTETVNGDNITITSVNATNHTVSYTSATPSRTFTITQTPGDLTVTSNGTAVTANSDGTYTIAGKTVTITATSSTSATVSVDGQTLTANSDGTYTVVGDVPTESVAVGVQAAGTYLTWGSGKSAEVVTGEDGTQSVTLAGGVAYTFTDSDGTVTLTDSNGNTYTGTEEATEVQGSNQVIATQGSNGVWDVTSSDVTLINSTSTAQSLGGAVDGQLGVGDTYSDGAIKGNTPLDSFLWVDDNTVVLEGNHTVSGVNGAEVSAENSQFLLSGVGSDASVDGKKLDITGDDDLSILVGANGLLGVAEISNGASIGSGLAGVSLDADANATNISLESNAKTAYTIGDDTIAVSGDEDGVVLSTDSEGNVSAISNVSDKATVAAPSDVTVNVEGAEGTDTTSVVINNKSVELANDADGVAVVGNTISDVDSGASLGGDGGYVVEGDLNGEVSLGNGDWTVGGAEVSVTGDSDGVVASVSSGSLAAVSELSPGAAIETSVPVATSSETGVYNVNGKSAAVKPDADGVTFDGDSITGVGTGASLGAGADEYTILPDDGANFSVASGDWKINDDEVKLSGDANGAGIYMDGDQVAAVTGLSNGASVTAPDDAIVTTDSISARGAEFTVNGKSASIANDANGVYFEGDTLGGVNSGASLASNAAKFQIAASDGAVSLGEGDWTINGDEVTFAGDPDDSTSAITAIVNNGSLAGIGGLSDNESVYTDPTVPVVTDTEGTFGINGSEINVSGDNSVVIDGNNVTGLAQGAVFGAEGIYTVNGEEFELDSDTSVKSTAAGLVSYDKADRALEQAAAAMPEGTHSLTATEAENSVKSALGLDTDDTIPAVVDVTLGGANDTTWDGDMILELPDLGDDSTIDANFSNNEGRKTVGMRGKGTSNVKFNDDGGNRAYIGPDAKGAKNIEAGDGGDVLENFSKKADVTLTGGAGADTITAAGGDKEVIDLSEGGADLIDATANGANIKGYDPNTGASFKTNYRNGKSLAAALVAGLIGLGKGMFNVTKNLRGGNVVLNRNSNSLEDVTDDNAGTFVKFQTTNGAKVLVGWGQTVGGALDASSATEGALLLGNAEQNATLGTSVTGSIYNDTILAGAGDTVKMSAGEDLINISRNDTLAGLRGAIIDMGDSNVKGEATVTGDFFAVSYDKGFSEGFNSAAAPDRVKVSSLDDLDLEFNAETQYDTNGNIVTTQNLRLKLGEKSLVIDDGLTYQNAQTYATATASLEDTSDTGIDHDGNVRELLIDTASQTSLRGVFIGTNSAAKVNNKHFESSEFFGQKHDEGRDTGAVVDYSNYEQELFVNMADTTTEGIDHFHNIDKVIGGSGKTGLAGDANMNILQAGAGETTLYGAAGRDLMIGYTGADSLKKGATEFFYADGNDMTTLRSFNSGTGETADILNVVAGGITNVSLQGDDLIAFVGGSYDDQVILEDKKNEIIKVKNLGADFVAEVGDNLTYNADVTTYYGKGDAAVSVGADAGNSDSRVEIWTNNAQDGKHYENIKSISATNYTGEAVLAGTGGIENSVTGGAGSSSLWGGGADNDTLIGGSGTNTFYYENGGGKDVITGAKNGDVVDLFGISLDDIASVDFDGNNVVATFKNNDGKLTVAGTGEVTYRLSDATFIGNHNNRTWSQPSSSTSTDEEQES